MHARKKGVAPGGAALLGVIGHEDAAFVADAVDVGCLPDRQAAVVDARLHPADIIAHDEQDVGFLVCCRNRSDNAEKRSRRYKQRQAVIYYVSFHFGFIILVIWLRVCSGDS
jgi:hypothetical protein